MSKKKIDFRVEILSYFNEKNEKEYYPALGFPIEVFVINENSKPIIFTTHTLNSSNFIFLSDTGSRKSLAASLKKLLFLGSYSLFDNFSWNFQHYQNQPKNNKNLNKLSAYFSQYMDTKIFQFEYVLNNHLNSVSKIYSNALWLERENSEMFNIVYLGLKDTRKLLLDYSTNSGIMLKKNEEILHSNFYKNYYGVNFFINK